MSVSNVTCICISGPLLLTSILNQRFQKALVSVHYILIYKADSVCVCVMACPQLVTQILVTIC